MFNLLASCTGLSILVLRLAPLLKAIFAETKSAGPPTWPSDIAKPLASIIIPARNEAANLPRLLKSLVSVTWRPIEIIIIDDQSTDETRTLANEFASRNPELNVRVISGEPRPADWTGKNWACHQGYLNAKGDYLLFTDADTSHEPLGLEISITRTKQENLSMLSAIPFHISETWWEPLLGPFHIFLLVTTGAFTEPKPDRVFAIGQFLLFPKKGYDAQGGHAEVRGHLGEDLELARRCLKSGGAYKVEFDKPVFKVRMYLSFTDFIEGWRRIFRLGFRHSSPLAALEVYCLIAALTASFNFFSAPFILVAIMLAALCLLLTVQKKLGEFSGWGLVFYPFSLLIFTVISILAALDLISQKRYTWRGRDYGATAD